MANPVLVEVLRGGRVEARHRGAVAVADPDGALVLALGDVDRPVFPRSAVKAIQALPLVEGGAAEALGLTDAELALACASHGGEPAHASTALGMLARVGRGPEVLECGAHWPMREEAARALAAEGGHPSALHNNCSGKHAAFVCLACAGLGADPAGYAGPEHPVQRAVRAVLADLTGVAHDAANRAVDGCAIPTHAAPLRALARAFARFGSGVHLPSDRARAANRLRRAVAAAPHMVGGTGTFDSAVAEGLGEQVLVKVGAEGVYAAALPELGLGLALKIEDGARRAAEVAVAALLLRFLPAGAGGDLLERLSRPALLNWNGAVVGSLRPAEALGGVQAS